MEIVMAVMIMILLFITWFLLERVKVMEKKMERAEQRHGDICDAMDGLQNQLFNIEMEQARAEAREMDIR